MNINATVIPDLLDNTEARISDDKTGSTNNIKNKTVDNITTNKVQDETRILKSNTFKDDYDRISDKRTTEWDSNTEQKLTANIIQKLGEIVTPENYSMFEELGIIPDQDDPTKMVTVSERIEIELATYCKNYKPVDNIDAQDIKNLYGNTALSYQVASELAKYNVQLSDSKVNEAIDGLEQAQDIQPITQQTSAYLLTNNKTLSIENIYMAQHSINTTSGSQYSPLNDQQWEELRPQVEKVITQSGLEVSDETLTDAKWLVEQRIPVTAQNLSKLSEIQTINSNLQQGISASMWIQSIAQNMSIGGSATDTPADVYQPVMAESIEAVEIITNGTEDQVETLVMDQKDVTLLNMKRLQEDRTQDRQQENNKEESRELIKAKRTLEEARLKMSVQSAATLIKNGIDIDVMPLSELVEELKKIENSYADNVFQTVNTGNTTYQATMDDKNLFLLTGSYMSSLSTTGAHILGDVANETVDFTVTDLVEQGRVKDNVVKKAMDSYDVLGTKPDKTLGDSLNKAFKGIDQIIENLGLKNTAENQRVIRILAYNQMELTNENVAKVKELDTQVSRLVENMTPKTTAYLIANGVNPLKTNISELNDTLDDIRYKIDDSEPEKFSTFLYQLDQHKEISEEDRDAYIGVYRLLNMVEKGDRSAIGELVKEGSDLTMRNLLTAVRSKKKTGKEYAVDDEQGLAEEINLSNDNIDRQLELFETSTFLKRANDMISPDTVRTILGDARSLDENGNENTTDHAAENAVNLNVMDMNLQEFTEYMSDQTIQKSEMDQRYASQFACDDISNLQSISEEAINTVLQDGVKPIMENLIGTTYLINSKSNLFRNIRNVCDDENVDHGIEELEKIMDQDGSEDIDQDSSAVIQQLKQTCGDIQEALMSKSHIDPVQMKLVSKATTYLQRAADQNSYYIPIKMGDNETTIKLTLKSSNGQNGKVDIQMSTNEFGNVNAQFSINNDKVQGILIASAESNELFSQYQDEFKNILQDKNMKLINMSYTTEPMDKQPAATNENNKANTTQLFTIAKQFIKFTKKIQNS